MADNKDDCSLIPNLVQNRTPQLHSAKFTLKPDLNVPEWCQHSKTLGAQDSFVVAMETQSEPPECSLPSDEVPRPLQRQHSMHLRLGIFLGIAVSDEGASISSNGPSWEHTAS
uniref:Uncharacterized protein n=1 Tax=Moniliophthora roreri TaxID=221103 RepID=A0A0W0EYQ1_MONRR